MKKLFLLFKVCDSFGANEYLAKLLYSEFLEVHPFSVSKILQKVRSNRKQERKSIYAVISDKKTLQGLDISTPEINNLIEFSEFVAEAHTRSKNEGVIVVFSYILRESGFLEYILGLQNNAQVLAGIDTVFNEIKREAFAKDEYTIKDFISYITVMKEHKLSIEIPTEHTDGVTLTTFHGSKYPELDYQEKAQSLISFLQEQELIEEVSVSEFEKEQISPLLTMLKKPNEVTLSLVDPEYITNRFTSRALSVSALNNFLDSPVLYFFRNLVLLPEAMSDVLEYGNCIHKVLEDFFRVAQVEKKVGSKEELLDVYEQVVAETTRWSKYRKQATETLSEYYDEYSESMNVPVEVEYGVFGVDFKLDRGGSIQLTGRIDKIEEDKEGNILVVDYKTGKSYSEKKGKNKEDTAKKKQAITRQAVFYALLLEQYRGGRYATRNVVFDFVQKNSSDLFERHEVVVTDEQLDELRDEINMMADAVLSGSFITDVYNTKEIDDKYKELFEIILTTK